MLAFACALIATRAAAQPSGQNGNLPLPPGEIERLMATGELEIEKVEGAGGGVMGAQKLGLEFDKPDIEFSVKWKAGASGGEGWNNAPRREIAAHKIQQLFLDPVDYVVPPVVVRCIPLKTYEPVEKDAAPTFEGTQCVFGSFSVWLKNVTMPKKAFDPERFKTDTRYAFHFANLNLLTYLIDHRDARQNNFLISTDPANPQTFSIDNGISFGGVLYNFFTSHLDRLRVGGLPQRSIERIRTITHDQWQRLAVVAQMQVDQQGILQSVPPTAPLDPNEGSRWRDGVLQLGLTTEEIAAVETRAQELLAEVDKGAIKPF
jgi:hypothetical protein